MIVIALICYVCLSTSFLSVPIVSQLVAVQQSGVSSAEVPKGRLVEKVICADDPMQSYALFVPSNYSDERKWPVLFAFDPGARGKVPVERYKDAAEKFGWILIGSNNSRNGPMQQSINAWNAMVKDAQTRFRIDERRVYATGFSGGARLAIFLGYQCQGCIAGVIAAGAGYPVVLDATKRSPLLIFATVGVDDFNFAEISELDQTLNKGDTNHLVEEFPGRHDWPPPDVAADAIEWMELQAMKSGTRLSDQQFIQSAWQSKWTRAHSLIDAKKYFEAFQAYSAIMQTFNTLHDVTEARNQLAKLQNNPEVKNAIRDEQRQITRQREIEARVRRLIAMSQRVLLRDDADDSADNSGRAKSVSEQAAPETQLENLFADLRKQAAKAEDNGDRRVARRVIDGAYINFFEQGRGELEQKHFDAAVRWFTLASETNPDRSGVFIYLASAYAGKGDKKKSLRALKTAADHGFSDVAAIANNSLFDSIRDDAQYREVMQTIQSKH